MQASVDVQREAKPEPEYVWNIKDSDVSLSSDEDEFHVEETVISKQLEQLILRETNYGKRKHQKNKSRVDLLDLYLPSKKIQDAAYSEFGNFALAQSSDAFRDYLKTEQLNVNNICQIFKTLLEIEDVTVMAQYVPLITREVSIEKPKMKKRPTNAIVRMTLQFSAIPNLWEILTPKIDEVMFVRRNTVYESLPTAKEDVEKLYAEVFAMKEGVHLEVYYGTVEKIVKDIVYFEMTDFYDTKEAQKNCYDIIFRPLRIPKMCQLRALDILAQRPEMRKYLFPTINPIKNTNKPFSDNRLKFVNPHIVGNREQVQAVCNIVDDTNTYAPYIIFGPPGTGKTTTIVEAILQLRLVRPESYIIVTAGSNSACNTITRQLCQSVKDNRNLENQIRRIFSGSYIRRKGISTIDPIVRKVSNCRDFGTIYSDLRKYRIIVATLCTVTLMSLGGSNKSILQGATHIFIDEAGASTEPETLLGIVGLKSDKCKIIISGDHKQLGPVLKSKRTIELGLEKSLMERLLERDCYAVRGVDNYDRSLQTRLRNNYRSHKEIVGLYNRLYYNNELIAAANLASVQWPCLPNWQFPIVFSAVHADTEEKKVGSSSTFNRMEIQAVMWYVKELLVKGVNGKPVQQEDIGIITPYNLQRRLINNRLYKKNWRDITVGSVELFQGYEKPVIIVSMVRSNKSIGFLNNPRRINVILSRAKSLLIIIGNPETLSKNPNYDYIIKQCRKNNSVVSYTSTPQKKETKRKEENN